MIQKMKKNFKRKKVWIPNENIQDLVNGVTERMNSPRNNFQFDRK